MKPYRLAKLKNTRAIYINYLNNYPQDKLGNYVGDDNEGKIATKWEIGNYIFNSGDVKNPAFETAFHTMQHAIFLGKNSRNITIANCTIEDQIDESNYYVLCFCLNKDDRMKEEFGSSMLIVRDTVRFLDELNVQMNKKGLMFVTAGKCFYINNRVRKYTEHDDKFITRRYLCPPYLLKDNSYSYQNEFRIIWKRVDNNKIIEPINIRCSKALKYCSFSYAP